MTEPTNRVRWSKACRIISSAYPPIDLFEDLADPEDWPLLQSAEQKTNPRLAETVGDLDLVPQERRIGGPGASYVMAPFVHASTDRAGRFHDGTFGAYYAGINFETALFETAHHYGAFYAATNETEGWIGDFRELVGAIDATFVDLRGGGHNKLLDANSYAASKQFAQLAKIEGSNGIVYPSVRFDQGECIAAFYPDVISIPEQGRHLSYHWNGEFVDQVKELTGGKRIFALVGE